LAKQETQMPLELPLADSGAEPVVSERPRITINVTAEGLLLLAGRSVTPAELQRRLSEQRAAEGDALEVRIRSDRSVAYRHVEPIMLSAARAGVWNVTFSVYKTEDVR
jgi:biopolymer transport protein ExbD